jgi:hypothetical protein
VVGESAAIATQGHGSAKGNYQQHLHQKEIAALPAPVQSLNARPFKNKQMQDEIGHKSRKIDKYQQIGQSLGAPTSVEAVQAMTPEMRQSKIVLGPIFVQCTIRMRARAARQRHSLQQRLRRARSTPYVQIRSRSRA